VEELERDVEDLIAMRRRDYFLAAKSDPFNMSFDCSNISAAKRSHMKWLYLVHCKIESGIVDVGGRFSGHGTASSMSFWSSGRNFLFLRRIFQRTNRVMFQTLIGECL